MTYKEMLGRVDEFVEGHFSVEERSSMLAGPEVADAWASKIHGRMLEREPALAAEVELFTNNVARRRRSFLKGYLREERDRKMVQHLQTTAMPRHMQAALTS